MSTKCIKIVPNFENRPNLPDLKIFAYVLMLEEQTSQAERCKFLNDYFFEIPSEFVTSSSKQISLTLNASYRTPRCSGYSPFLISSTSGSRFQTRRSKNYHNFTFHSTSDCQLEVVHRRLL